MAGLSVGGGMRFGERRYVMGLIAGGFDVSFLVLMMKRKEFVG